MKKTVFTILIICLVAGIPLMVLDMNPATGGGLKTLPGHSKIVIGTNDKSRENEEVFSTVLKAPTFVDLYIQSDSKETVTLAISSDQRIIGKRDNKYVLYINKVPGNSGYSLNQLFGPGNLTIRMTNEKSPGKLDIRYSERPADASEYERLSKIDNGDLDNPPEGYYEVCRIDLSGLNCNEEPVYSFTLDSAQTIGISIYTDTEQGEMSVDIIGPGTNFFAVVNSVSNRICDQLQLELDKGTYEVRLNSENADGQLYVFIKK